MSRLKTLILLAPLVVFSLLLAAHFRWLWGALIAHGSSAAFDMAVGTAIFLVAGILYGLVLAFFDLPRAWRSFDPWPFDPAGTGSSFIDLERKRLVVRLKPGSVMHLQPRFGESLVEMQQRLMRDVEAARSRA